MRTAAVTALLVLLAASSGAQQLSSDGRSVVGRTTALDRLVRFLDPDRLLIGLSSDELKLWAERLYPQEGTLHNRAGHRLGSRILTDRFGAVAATALGIANEIFEAYNLRHIGAPVISTERFDLEDLAANFRGVYDSYAMDLNTPWGMIRLFGQWRDSAEARWLWTTGRPGRVTARDDGADPRPSRPRRARPHGSTPAVLRVAARATIPRPNVPAGVDRSGPGEYLRLLPRTWGSSSFVGGRERPRPWDTANSTASCAPGGCWGTLSS